MFPAPHSIDPSQAEPPHPLPQAGSTSIIDGPHQACELRKQTRQKQGIGAEGGGQAAWLRRAWQVPTSSGLLTICTAQPARARLEGPLGTPFTPKRGVHVGLHWPGLLGTWSVTQVSRPCRTQSPGPPVGCGAAGELPPPFTHRISRSAWEGGGLSSHNAIIRAKQGDKEI